MGIFLFKSPQAQEWRHTPTPAGANEPALKWSGERTKRKGLRPRLTACRQEERTTGGRFHCEVKRLRPGDEVVNRGRPQGEPSLVSR